MHELCYFSFSPLKRLKLQYHFEKLAFNLNKLDITEVYLAPCQTSVLKLFLRE